MMHLITTLMYIILLFSINIESTLFRNSFRSFVKSVATIFHENWRENFLAIHPYAKHRFKLTKSITHYNSSDFIYPMILTVGLCLVHRNLKVARDKYNSSIIYVDILNMEFNELPSDWAYENRATARVACKQIFQNVRKKHLFNQNLIEEMSEKIHDEWIKRNVHQLSQQHLMIPYGNLTEIEKSKDRRAILIACRLFNQLHLYRRFKIAPIYFIGFIIQSK